MHPAERRRQLSLSADRCGPIQASNPPPIHPPDSRPSRTLSSSLSLVLDDSLALIPVLLDESSIPSACLSLIPIPVPDTHPHSSPNTTHLLQPRLAHFPLHSISFQSCSSPPSLSRCSILPNLICPRDHSDLRAVDTHSEFISTSIPYSISSLIPLTTHFQAPSQQTIPCSYACSIECDGMENLQKSRVGGSLAVSDMDVYRGGVDGPFVKLQEPYGLVTPLLGLSIVSLLDSSRHPYLALSRRYRRNPHLNRVSGS
ncbi:hypothetical protein JAAARDRAFT_61789 [Jaapia argillacea MUCL 33604]|uniref:Uncharacterized protein n=1 Tax=Jaapia argillacea MUCL 33604 TaxID=933084 RepID=A0A067PR47_9AGAM|nr:hypothetical protein JAAARDRAFT_61789 [Jaapia argillacea MUCL 33604]